MNFVDIDLERSSNNFCGFDYVDIYEGLSVEEDKRLGRYCHPGSVGNDLPLNGSTALVRFRTDNYAATGGFKLRYR